MADYTVTMTAQVTASNPREAVRFALDDLQDCDLCMLAQVNGKDIVIRDAIRAKGEE